MKVGFGTATNAEQCQAKWRHDLEVSKKAAPYQVRVHVYQGEWQCV